MEYFVKNIYGKTNNNPISVSVPGSKSITARALFLAALANGKSTLFNVQFSDDCATFLNCLSALGISCRTSGATVTIEGCGGVLPVKEAEIYVGSAGTAARFLLPLLALNDGVYKVDASEQMRRRPIAPLLDCLKSLGAAVESANGSFPIKITGCKSALKRSVSVDITASSQFLSALLMAAPCVPGGVEISVRGAHGLGYVDMTLGMMWSLGVAAEEREGGYFVKGAYQAKRYEIEPDVSAACYFYAANRLLGTNISVRGLLPHSMQGDMKFIGLIKNFNGGEVDMSGFSDQALTLAAVAPYFENPTRIRNIGHIRGQECDRISAMSFNLGAMGVRCTEEEDGIIIYPSAPRPAHINAFGDHRVAMSFALTGLRADGIVVDSAEVCSKTFKNYFEVLDNICAELTK